MKTKETNFKPNPNPNPKKKKKKKKKKTNKTILGGLVCPENGRANRDEPKEDKLAVRMQLARILCIIWVKLEPST